MPHDPYKALYMHIPFCPSRCIYCDFATRAVPKDDARIDDYVERLVRALRTSAKEGDLSALETIYIGGGTPSYIGASRLSSLLYAVSVSVDLGSKDFEFSMEANPESLDEALVRDIWALGVNRLSIGVQSFDDELLNFLSRAHNADDAKRAIAAAQSRFENVSIDLICGIPGQTLETFEASLNEAISLGVKHISVYPLSVEQHTLLERRVLAGEIPEPDDDTQARHMQQAAALLAKVGFQRYEVASYAQPGFECRHNMAYWTGFPYLGIGESATTMTQNDEHRMRMTDGYVTDGLNRAEREAEDMMLGMRLAQGLADSRVDEACVYLPRLKDELKKLYEEGYLTHESHRWQPSEQGWLCGNDVFERLLALTD